MKASIGQNLLLKCASNRKLAAFLLLLLLLAPLGAFYGTILLGEKVFHIADHTYYFEPFTKFISSTLASNRLPLWNPYLYCGMPQIAVPSPGMFFPPNLLFIWLPYSKALSLIIALSQLAMALGTFLLVASFGWGLTAATVAGITISLCGYMFSLENNYTLVAAAAWAPLMIWSSREIMTDLSKSKRPYFAAAILIISTFLSISAGRPEVFVPACFITVLVCLRDAWICHRRKQRILPALAWQYGSMFVGILLSMPILLPTIEWVRLSPRANGLNLSQTFMWSVNWYDLMGIVFAYPFGDLQRVGVRHLSLVATRPVFLPFVQSCYIGPIAWTCAIWGMFDKTWKGRRVLLIYASCVLILCLGEYTPVAPALMQTFPALTAFRFPIKWMIFFLLALAIAAARGASNLVRSKIDPVGRKVAVTFWVLSFIAATTFITLSMRDIPLNIAKPPLPVDAELLLGVSLLLGAMYGSCACGLEWLRSINRISAFKAAIIFPCLIAVSLIIPACKFQQVTTSPEYFETSPVLRGYLDQAKNNLNQQNKKQSGDGRFLALYFDPLWVPVRYRTSFDPDWKTDYDAHYTTAYSEYTRQLLLPNTNMDQKVPETFGYEAAETGPYRQLFFDILHQCSVCMPGNRASDRPADTRHYSDVPLLRFCQSTGTSWIGTQSYKGPDKVSLLDSRFFTLMKEDKEKNVRLFHVKYPLPRAYLSRYWMWCDEQKPILEKIRNADSSQFNPAVTTMIERNTTSGVSDIKGTDRDFGPKLATPPEQSPTLPPETEHTSFSDRDPFIDTFPVTIMTDEPEHLSMSVKPDRDCFLVLTDHFYPGWQASIDGAKRPCYRVNAEGRAVYVPAGPHLIEFTYFPDSLVLGFQLAAAGLVILIFLIAAGLRPRLWRFLKFLAGQE
ncbi:MAG: hypothetical protein U0103_04930 [Candidatus Obscuribacterales bacterium]